jgi:hypothetical protein
MAHHRQGNVKQAQEWFHKAVQWIQEVNWEDADQGPARTSLSWNRRVTLRLLRQEAERLLGIADKADPADDTMKLRREGSKEEPDTGDQGLGNVEPKRRDADP